MKLLAQRLLLLLTLLLLLVSCGGGGSSGSGSVSGTTPVSITFGYIQKEVAKSAQAPVPADAQYVLLFVEAADIAPRIVAEKPVTPGQTATLTVTVPNGTDRRFEVWAYNGLGVETYVGVTFPVNLTGTPVTVPLDMLPPNPVCQFQIQQFVPLPLNGQPQQVQLQQVSGQGACAWRVVYDPATPWVTVTPSSGFGPQQLTFSASPNATPRFGSLAVAGQQIQVAQEF